MARVAPWLRCRSLDVTMTLFHFRGVWCEGVVAQMKGDKAAADAAFTTRA